MTDPNGTPSSSSQQAEVGTTPEQVGELLYLATTDGGFRYWNDALSEVTGYSDDELETMEPADLFISDDQVRIREAIGRASEEGHARIEAVLQTKDGERLPSAFTKISFTKDATSWVAGVGRTSSENTSLVEQHELYKYSYNSSLTGIAIGDLEGDLQAVNPMFLDMWGYEDEDEVLGRSVTEFWKDPEEAGRVAQTLQETGDWQGRLLAVRKDGTEFYAQCSTSLITDDSGETLSMMASFVDISDQIERERELEEQTEQMKEFANVISHDLRNPLNIASVCVQTAQDEYGADHLDQALEALERMEEIIADSLVLAQEGQAVGEQEWIQTEQLAVQCWGMIETGGYSLEFAEPFEVYADWSRLRHVFENLFRNTVEHSDGECTVRVGPLGEAGFYIEDDGPGIPEEERKNVLEPGETTHPDGTGFGLAIVNRIAQAHSWDLRISDGTDGGARFEFTNVDTRSGGADTS